MMLRAIQLITRKNSDRAAAREQARLDHAMRRHKALNPIFAPYIEFFGTKQAKTFSALGAVLGPGVEFATSGDATTAGMCMGAATGTAIAMIGYGKSFIPYLGWAAMPVWWATAYGLRQNHLRADRERYQAEDDE